MAQEYQREALESFQKMEEKIKHDMIRNILLSELSVDKEDNLHIVFP